MKIDKRTKLWRNRYTILAYFLLAFIGVSILYATLRPYFVTEPLISPLSDFRPMSEEEVVTDYKELVYPSWVYDSWPQSVTGIPNFAQPCPTPTRPEPRVDPISYIRQKGEELDVPNRDIRALIRIAKCESHYRPTAKNPNSSASGVMQIIAGTWYHYGCTGDKWDFKDNIDCGFKIYEKSGLSPWNASKHCWQEI